jgi:serine/threonine protein kinase
MTSGRDDDRSSPGESDLLTSEDLFGDMLDEADRSGPAGAKAAPSPAPVGPARGAPIPTRSAPIKVKLGVPAPGAAPVPARTGGPLSGGTGDALPDDVAALLDMFGDEPATAAPAPAAKAPEPPPRRAAEGGMDALVEDLLSLEPGPEAAALPSRVPPRPAPVAPPDAVKPAARTGTKFQAAAPKATAVPEGGGLDLAGLAEDAFAHADPQPPAADGSASEVVVSTSDAPLEEPEEDRPAPAPANTADMYGPYRLVERIAIGGMAEVFRAKRSGVEGFEKTVAVKRILSHLSDNKEFVDMFINEAKVVSGLTHPNIVQIFDLGKIDRSYYIAMEYVQGRDLRTILRRARERGIAVPHTLAAYVVSRMCAALEYAHRKRDEAGEPMRIVHRDVSPQNILLSFEGDVKLTDFGIAKAASKATVTDKGALRGKLLYMSPEQAWGNPMDRRSDIFSLGIVLYEMLTGQKPFVGTSETSILDTVRACKVAPPTSIDASIPEKMERVALKALERDPEVRYQDAAEMQRDIERLLHEGEAPTPRDVTLFLERLFDQGERGTSVSADWTPDRPSAVHLQADPAAPPAAKAKDKDAPAIQKLLKRFGIG